MRNYQKKALLLVILLTMLCNSSTALSQYLDVFSASGPDSFVIFRVNEGANDLLNPTIIIYSSEISEVFIGGNMIINGSGKIILNITVSQRINIFNSYKNLTFWADKITDDPLYEQANFINEEMINIAFSSGFIQALVASFVIGPIIALIIRRNRL